MDVYVIKFDFICLMETFVQIVGFEIRGSDVVMKLF